MVIASQAALDSNTLLSNTTEARGGGLCLIDQSTGWLTNNVVAANEGHGIYVGGSQVYAAHTTLADNGDAGIVFEATGGVVASQGWLTNSIIVGHQVGVTVAADCEAQLEATLWGSAGWANELDADGAGQVFSGTLNYWGLPHFVSPCVGVYAIGWDSHARDRGVFAGVLLDRAGQRRHGSPDLGAYETPSRMFLPLIFKS